MPKYRVHHVYAAYRDGVHYGPYTPGEEIEIEQELADWMNRDSPGVLEEVREMPPTPDRAIRKSPKTR